MNPLIIALSIFVLAAVFGLMILIRILKGESTPKPAVFIHGLLAALALGILIFYAITSEKSPVLSLVVFLIAALGGFLLFFLDMAKRPLPKFVALIHAGAAVLGVVLLLLFIVGI